MKASELRDIVHNVPDLMRVATNALYDRDIETLEGLQSLAEGWLQSDDEKIAQRDLFDAMIEIVYDADYNDE